MPSNTDRTVAAPSQLKNQHIKVAKKPALNVLSPKGTVTQVQAQLAKDQPLQKPLAPILESTKPSVTKTPQATSLSNVANVAHAISTLKSNAKSSQGKAGSLLRNSPFKTQANKAASKDLKPTNNGSPKVPENNIVFKRQTLAKIDKQQSSSPAKNTASVNQEDSIHTERSIEKSENNQTVRKNQQPSAKNPLNESS